MTQFSQQFLENILDSSSTAVFIKDSNLKFVYINDAFTRLLGLREQDILGKDDYDFFPPAKADIFKAIDEAVLQTGESNFNEERLLGHEGTTLTLNTGKSRAEDEFGNYYIVGNIYDNTEKKQLIDNLQMSNEMLKRYAHLVSHDLKSPVSSIHRFSELLSRSLSSNLDETEAEYLNFITRSSKRLFNLVEKILDFSHLNTQDLRLEKVNVNELLVDVKSDLRILIEEGGCTINLKSLPNEIVCDKHLLSSVFQNLISNGIKFRADDRACAINVSCTQEEKDFVFTIEDNGIGIAEKEQDQIFEMFARLNSNITGSGIGLALSRMIVNRHGGKIWLASEIGKGSTFSFNIPREVNIPIHNK